MCPYLTKKVKPALVIVLLLVLLTWSYLPQCFAMTADNVIPLVNEQYFFNVHEALTNAKESIFCVMYLAKISKKDDSSLSNTLIRDLIKAHKRGVNVKVIFDQNVQFWERGRKRKKVERKSEDAYQMLAKAGVPVYYDDKNQITHNKIIVIDNYITIVGSTNWTNSALKNNNEASVIIESKEAAEEFTRRLKMVPKDKVME